MPPVFSNPDLGVRADLIPALTDRLDEAVWVKSPDGEKLLYVNASLTSIYGFTVEEFAADPHLWLSIVHADDLEIAHRSTVQLQKAGASEAVYRVLHRDGSVVWVRDRQQLLRNENGQVIATLGQVRDVTDEKLTERLYAVQNMILENVANQFELSASLDKLCLAVEEFLPRGMAAVSLLDPESRRLKIVASPSYDADLKQALDDVVPGMYSGSSGVCAMTGKPIFVAETRNDERWADYPDLFELHELNASWAQPVFGAGHQVIGTLSIASPIVRTPNQMHRNLLAGASHLVSIAVQNHENRAALIRAKESAEQGARLKSELLANVSHELRTPMTAILGFTQLLLQEDACGAEAESRQDDLRTIERNGRYLLNLINNLLDLSKMEADKLEVETLPCDIRSLIQEVCNSLAEAARRKKIGLKIEYLSAIPDSIDSDSTRLRQILFNLVGNAIKFTESGRVTIRVHAKPFGEGVELSIDVSDTGIGMTAEESTRIFAPFTQADSTTARRFGGSGLGLAVSRELAQVLGGNIHVRSQKNVGSTFSLELSAKCSKAMVTEAPQGEKQIADRTPLKAARKRLPTGARYLLVEDGPDNRRLIEHLLRRAGAEVVCAENGQEAIQCLLHESTMTDFDAILMDMQMPIMDGFEATQILRENGCQLPIIALTARTMLGDRERCLEAGCDGYLTKPIDATSLVAQLAQQTMVEAAG